MPEENKIKIHEKIANNLRQRKTIVDMFKITNISNDDVPEIVEFYGWSLTNNQKLFVLYIGDRNASKSVIC